MRKKKLHTKFIILLTSVSLVPLVIVAGVTLLRFQKTLEADAAKLGHQVAATATAEIKSFMLSQLRILDSIAALYNPAFPIKPDVAEKVLENILFQSENFEDISVVNKDGQETARKNRLLVITSGDLRDTHASEAFQTVRHRGLYVGPVYVRSGRPFFDLGRQIVDTQGAFVGAVFAQVDARVMPLVIGDISHIVGPSDRVYMVNEKGVVIVHPDISYVLAERDLSYLPTVKAIIATPHEMSISATYDNEFGERVLGSAHPVTIELFDLLSNGPSLINWFVIVERPEAVVYADARAAAWFLVLIALAAAALVAGSAVYFAGRISSPIEALHTATLEFGRGNLTYRADVKTGDEIEDLAGSFNTMAGDLALTVASLKNEELVTAAERNKLRLILSGITNAVVAVDTNQKVILFNEAAEALTGKRHTAVLGKSIGEAIRIFDGQREVKADEFCAVHKDFSEGPLYSGSGLRMPDSKGAEHFVNVMVGRIREGASINLGCVLTFQDITREFIMERTKREFVSIAAHQLRTPLTGMSWAIELLLSEVKGALNAAQKELVEKSIGAVHRMVELVDDLLDVSRIEEGRFGMKLSLQPIYPVLTRVLDIFRKEAQAKHIELSTDLEQEFPSLYLDANKLEFAISNILDNAMKYTPSEGKVVVSAKRKGDEIVVSVKDTGIGIPAAEFDRVFTKFFRSREALSYFTDGSGLGLYVTKNVVNEHGGKVWFESEQGKGTTFYVSLPIPRVAAVSNPQPFAMRKSI